MKRMKSSCIPLWLTALGCLVMAWVEAILQPVYGIKTLLKWLVFGSCISLSVLLTGERTPLSVFHRPSKRAFLPAAGLALAVFAVIWGGYALLRPWLDLSAVTRNLTAKEGITAATFPIVALYISFINSLLEEVFFRGFAYLSAAPVNRRLAAVVSSLAFALYHVCIMGSWFHPVWFLLFTAALALVGLFFNRLDREGTIWPAWLVHMSANLALNTIGMRLFGIL